MEKYCLYLRKSRADIEAEARGEGETLARHESALLSLAKSQNIPITSIYKEIVSGENISARPVMQMLLNEVEEGKWSGVLVMEVERLARGDTIDQGIVARAFSFSHTKIITPIKTYDPDNEYDEEYFEFGLFMSRREYKTINRRLQRGRKASSEEGKFIGSIAPYGYIRTKLKGQKGYTLLPDSKTAPIVKLIFKLYASGDPQTDGTIRKLSFSKLAKKLDDMGIKPARSNLWSVSTLQSMLKNPVYIGKIRSMERPLKKIVVNGSIKTQRPTNPNSTVFDGLHEPIISKETWDNVQKLLYSQKPIKIKSNKLKNPLAGLIICSRCGKLMVRKPYYKSGNQMIICTSKGCSNVGANLSDVEKGILESLSLWLSSYKFCNSHNACIKQNKYDSELVENIMNLEKDIEVIDKQMANIHDFLEQNIYTPQEFQKRKSVLSKKRELKLKTIISLKEELKSLRSYEKQPINIDPRIDNMKNSYYDCASIEAKHDFLCSIIDKIIYTKNKRGAPFELILYPKLPDDQSVFMDINNEQKN